MLTFYTISSVRNDIERYKKNDSYSRCCDDLCNFFKGKDLETIYSYPYLIFEGRNCRYLKSRLENSNSGKGKSSGYRIYYYVDKERESVTIIGFYPKTGKYGKSDITNAEEKIIIKRYKEELTNGELVRHDIENAFILQGV